MRCRLRRWPPSPESPRVSECAQRPPCGPRRAPLLRRSSRRISLRNLRRIALALAIVDEVDERLRAALIARRCGDRNVVHVLAQPLCAPLVGPRELARTIDGIGDHHAQVATDRSGARTADDGTS